MPEHNAYSASCELEKDDCADEVSNNIDKRFETFIWESRSLL